MKSGQFRSAVIDGALALEHGLDPVRYLDSSGEERLLLRQVLQEAIDRRVDREKQQWKNLQVVVQNGVARAFGGK